MGGVQVGGGAPISVQSMTKTDTRDIASTVKQINELAESGCDIIRAAVPDWEAADALPGILKAIGIPFVADIHFDYRLAMEAIKAGINGLRINPGNIGGRNKVEEVVRAAQDGSIPIRIGVNAGSLEKELLVKYGGVTPGAMVESAMGHVNILEDLNFSNIKISLKASNVPLMLEAYRLISEKTDYPLHIGVTESGTLRYGTVKSAIGIGILLSEGIGDTIRVSLTGHPCHEITAGYDILRALGLRSRGVELISCPTCGRTEIDLIGIAEEVEKKLQRVNKPLKIAVMGCAVNGPGEAREADLGIAGGKGFGLIFRRGKIIRKVPEGSLVEELLKEIENI